MWRIQTYLNFFFFFKRFIYQYAHQHNAYNMMWKNYEGESKTTRKNTFAHVCTAEYVLSTFGLCIFDVCTLYSQPSWFCVYRKEEEEQN